MLRSALVGLVLLSVTLPAQEDVDLEVVHRIRQEAFEHSEVMDHLFQLVDVHGPRITGLLGFQFIQDAVEYDTRTHHSNMDAYDRAQPADLIQASAIVAAFVYHAANREELFPRKPLPEPQPLTKPEK